MKNPVRPSCQAWVSCISKFWWIACVVSSALKPTSAHRKWPIAKRSKEVEQEGKHAKQSGGKGQYGHVWIKMGPNETGKGFEFVDAIKGAPFRRIYPAVERA